ncbi:hypothetical protein J2S68_000360 [Glycomyces algeriensis]|nr:hypothetical protein [Glycomyces algeriensis]MDR7348817.1 hypothetical protein [Glycomyces algeriensis]
MAKQTREERQAANRQFDADKARLDKLGKAQSRRGQREENSAYHHQNKKVDDAIQNKTVSWWKR